MKKKKLALHWQIIIGLVLGVGYAFLSATMGWSEFTMDWVAPWGDIFINLLKLIAVPLVLFSIIAGVVSLGDPSKLGRMGIKTLGLYLATTLLACGVGLTVVNLWQPGAKISEEARIINRIKYENWVAQTEGVEIIDGKSFLTEYASDGVSLKYQEQIDAVAAAGDSLSAEDRAVLESKQAVLASQKDAGPLGFVVDMVPDNIFVSLGNNKMMLQVIFFAIFFGIVMLTIDRSRAQPVIDVIHGLGDIFVKMVDVVMRAAPFFVFALLAGSLTDLAGDDINKMYELFGGLLHYSGAVVLGLFIMILIIYPLLTNLIAKMPIPKFMKGIMPAQMMAFSTSSSVATLPVTLECTEDNLGVSKKVTSFVLPIGATVNMDGTSLYQAVAVVFMAQLHYIDLDFTQQLTIVLTTTLASIGAAAVPGAGLILMMVVLESVGLNPAWIMIITPVDRILDMIRTSVNVTGDACVSSIIAKSEGQLHTDTEPPQTTTA